MDDEADPVVAGLPTCAAFMNTIRWVGSPGDSRSMISRM